MGTSSSRSGKYSNHGGLWSKAKATTTRFANQTGGNAGAVVGAFAGAVRSSASGRGGSVAIANVGARLGHIFQSIAQSGLAETLKQEGLSSLIGKSAKEVLAGLIDHICKEGSILDDAIPRAAILDVMIEIFNDQNSDYKELQEAWDNQLNEDRIKEVLELYLSCCIIRKFMMELGVCFENGSINATQAAAKEEEIGEFVKAMVSLELEGVNIMTLDWNSQKAQGIIERNVQAALDQLEAYSE